MPHRVRTQGGRDLVWLRNSKRQGVHTPNFAAPASESSFKSNMWGRVGWRREGGGGLSGGRDVGVGAVWGVER